MNHRYSKQTALPEIGPDGQEALRNAKILYLGAGGLASGALPYLAAAGVGKIGIVDHDSVELSNLQRQVLYSEAQLHSKKVFAAKESLLALNSDLAIDVYPEKLTAQNIESLFSQYDLILDGTDNFQTKYLINDAAIKLEKPVIFASAIGFEGQLFALKPEVSVCFRCIYPDVNLNTPTCDTRGVFGPAVGIMGVLQASEAIKYFLKSYLPSIHSELLTIDFRDLTFLKTKLKQKEDCMICTTNKSKIKLYMTEFHCVNVGTITAEEALRNKNEAILIDVREDHERLQLLGSTEVHIPLSKIRASNLMGIPKSKQLILFCNSGARSYEAARLLKDLGYTNVVSLKNGISDIRAHLKNN